jgi:hypothetical protein
MKYLLTLYGDETRWTEQSPEEMQAAMKGWEAYSDAATEAGVMIGGEGLQPSATATTVKLGDEPIVTDGPFAETKEQLGGYYLLDCKDLDEAIEWAKRIPSELTVEIRPVMDYEAAGMDRTGHPTEAQAR